MHSLNCKNIHLTQRHNSGRVLDGFRAVWTDRYLLLGQVRLKAAVLVGLVDLHDSGVSDLGLKRPAEAGRFYWVQDCL